MALDRSLLEDLLADYRAVVARIDAHVAGVIADWGEHLACAPGCDRCCRHLNVFAVEAVALALALQEVPRRERSRLADRSAGDLEQTGCPLLSEGLCSLYGARPLICQTHGLPLLVTEGEGRRVDTCPENFRGLESLPGAAVLDLERLNTLLAVVNRRFVAGLRQHGVQLPERLPLASALGLQL